MPHLQRRLSNRHIQLIAIGGAIGTGLFMGSGRTISLAGPAVLVVYAIIGFFVFFVLRAMGELLLSNLNYKSFVDFTADLLGPAAAFYLGWSYWFAWVVTGIADLVAITGYARFWWPASPVWLPALLTVGLILTVNLFSVGHFGEMEFWLALIKVVAILSLILLGAFLVVTNFVSPQGDRATIENLWNDGGLFPQGFMGLASGFQIAFFAYIGVELVGTAAGETANPRRTIPRAINAVPVRVAIFYVGALVAILAVVPWRRFASGQSPFVTMFSLAGLAAAASVVNFVVTTAAASSANSGVFSTGRMLFGLADEGSAPAVFQRLNRGGGACVGHCLHGSAAADVHPAALRGRFGDRRLHTDHHRRVAALHVRVDDDRRQLPRVPPPASTAARRLHLQDARRCQHVLGGPGLLCLRDLDPHHQDRNRSCVGAGPALVRDPHRGLAHGPAACRERARLCRRPDQRRTLSVAVGRGRPAPRHAPR